MMNDQKIPYKLIVYMGLGLLLFLILGMFKPFTIIKAGDRGVMMRFGKVQDAILDEGLHPIIPVVNTVKSLSVRVQKNDIDAEASSKDLQDIKTQVALRARTRPVLLQSKSQMLKHRGTSIL